MINKMEEERKTKSYDGEMMKKGTINEDVYIEWREKMGYKVVDNRDKRFEQFNDVDFAVVNSEGIQVTEEIKSDKNIGEFKNLFFESERIYHFAKEDENRIKIGWGWRSSAQKLIVRNPETGEIFVFNFQKLRKAVNDYIKRVGRSLEIKCIETDKTKTTIGYLIHMYSEEMIDIYEKFNYLNNDEYLKRDKTI
jgi:hypothetical protein